MSDDAREEFVRERAHVESIDPDAPVREPPENRQWDVTLAVMVGGVIGAEARYGLANAAPHAANEFAWSTLYINVAGCFALGVLMAVLGLVGSPNRLIRPFAGIGILGGFTTFSTFSVDAERLIRVHRPGIALLYVLCTLAAAAAAVLAATSSVHLIARRSRGGPAPSEAARDGALDSDPNPTQAGH